MKIKKTLKNVKKRGENKKTLQTLDKKRCQHLTD